jgi:hypothetical protein
LMCLCKLIRMSFRLLRNFGLTLILTAYG